METASGGCSCWGTENRSSGTTTRTRAQSPVARCQLALVALACSCLMVPLQSHAQMTDRYMHASSPDVHDPHVWTAVVALLLSVPVFALCGVLLVKRRSTFPIAGRFLIHVLFTNLAIINVSNLVTLLFYTDGLPCGLQLLLSHSFTPLVLLWLVRGWLLASRLEIQNYLMELTWRQYKQRQMKQRHIGCGGGNGSGNGSEQHSGIGHRRGFSARVVSVTPGAVTGASSASAAAGGAAPAAPSDPSFVLPCLDSSSIEGHLWIQNRNFTSVRWVGAAVAVWSSCLLLAVIVSAIFDPDIQFFRDWRARQGLPPGDSSSQFTHGAVFDAPRCFWYSTKMMVCFGHAGIAMPYGLWCCYRVWVHSHRMKQRTQEQTDFARAIAAVDAKREAELQQQHPHAAILLSSRIPPLSNHHHRLLGAGAASPMSTSSSMSGTASPSELDEYRSVKVEMAVTVVTGGGTMLAVLALTAWAADKEPWANILAAWILLTVSVIQPLRTSFSIERKQRELFQNEGTAAAAAGGGGGRGRGSNKNNGAAKFGNGGGTGKRSPQFPPHHRPLYRLRHVLTDPHCYPLLLKFLQKEYSSENALFYSEAKDFEMFCRQLETILHWDPDRLADEVKDADPAAEPEGNNDDDEEEISNVGRGGAEALLSVSEGNSLTSRPQGGQRGTRMPIVSQMTAIGEGNHGGGHGGNGGGTGRPLAASHLAVAGRGGGGGGVQMAPVAGVAAASPAGAKIQPPLSPSHDAHVFEGLGDGGELIGWEASSIPPRSRAAIYAAAPTRLVARQSFRSKSKSRTHSRAPSAAAAVTDGDTSPLPLPSSSRAQPPHHPQHSPPPHPLHPPPRAPVPVGLGVCVVDSLPLPSSHRHRPTSSSEAASGLSHQQARKSNERSSAVVPLSPSGAANASTLAPNSPFGSERSAQPQQQQQPPPAQPRHSNPGAGAAAAASRRLSPVLPSAVTAAAAPSFRQLHSHACRAKAWALRIYADYIKHNSVYQINIDNDLARMLGGQVQQLRLWQPTPLDSNGQPDLERAAVESAPPLPPPFLLSSLYKQTALSVFNLMERDSFRRFLLTADFQLLLQRADELEAARVQRAAHTAAAAAAAAASSAIASAAAAAAPDTSVVMFEAEAVQFHDGRGDSPPPTLPGVASFEPASALARPS